MNIKDEKFIDIMDEYLDLYCVKRVADTNFYSFEEKHILSSGFYELVLGQNRYYVNIFNYYFDVCSDFDNPREICLEDIKLIENMTNSKFVGLSNYVYCFSWEGFIDSRVCDFDG